MDNFYSLELEEKAIGCAMQFSDTLDDFITLTEYDFHGERNREIFKAIQAVSVRQEVNTISLYQYFQKNEIDVKATDLTSRQNKAISNTEMRPCMEALRKFTQRRSIRRVGNYFLEKSGDPTLEPMELMTKAMEYIDKGMPHTDPEPLKEIIKARLAAYINQNVERGIGTGLRELDNVWAGFFPGELTILAARPSMGKTALAQYMALQFPNPVVIFSIEMKKEYLADRYLAAELNTNLDNLRRGIVPRDKLKNLDLDNYNDKIFIDDTSRIATFDVMAQSRRLKRKHGLGLVIVDFLTLLSDDREGRESDHQRVNRITRTLRDIGKSLDIPMLVLAQLSREVESRPDKRPILRDLRESGGIEEAADNVLFLYRDEYYKKDTPKKNILEIIVAKQKQGARGVTAEAYFDASRGVFKDIARREEDYLDGPAPF